MKNGVLLAAVAVAVGVLAGCSKHAASSSETIQHAKTLNTPEQQADYLVSEARAFMKSEDYQEAIKTAQYVLVSVDAHSRAAADLLEQAEAQLAADAKAVVRGTKNAVGL